MWLALALLQQLLLLLPPWSLALSSDAAAFTTLTPGTPNAKGFGASVSLSGTTAVVGAPDQGDGEGAVYIYESDGRGAWAQSLTLEAPEGGSFGCSVSVFGDVALIGAWALDASRGAAYVYAREGGGWLQHAELRQPSGRSGDEFGWSVSVAGSEALIGSPGQEEGRGAAYFFRRSSRGAWQETIILQSGADEAFGYQVSLAGSMAIVGAPRFGSGAGAAYVLEGKSGKWDYDARLVAPDGMPGDNFGISVAILADRAVVGAGSGTSRRGSVYLFARSANGGWHEPAVFSGAQEDSFGCSVGVSAQLALAGAKGRRGAVYSFFKAGSEGWREGVALSTDGDVGTLLGASISVSDTSFLVGEPGRTSLGGVVRLYSNLSALLAAVDEGQQSSEEGPTGAGLEFAIFLGIGLALVCCLGVCLVRQWADRRAKPKNLLEDGTAESQPSGPEGNCKSNSPPDAAERCDSQHGAGGDEDECMTVPAVMDAQHNTLGGAELLQNPMELQRELPSDWRVEVAAPAVLATPEGCADSFREFSDFRDFTDVAFESDAATSPPASVPADSPPSSCAGFVQPSLHHVAIPHELGWDESEVDSKLKVRPSDGSYAADLDCILEGVVDNVRSFSDVVIDDPHRKEVCAGLFAKCGY